MKPLGELESAGDGPPQRTALWVISRHVGLSLLGSVAVLVLLHFLWVVAILALPLDFDSIRGLLIGWAVWALGGLAGAEFGSAYLRRKARFAGPSRFVITCAFCYGVVLLDGVLLAGMRMTDNATPSDSFRAVLLAAPATLGFWWQTRQRFRKWEREQEQPKSYGFPVVPAAAVTFPADKLPQATIGPRTPSGDESRPTAQS